MRAENRWMDMNEIVYDLALAALAFFLFGPRAVCAYLMAMTVYYMVKMTYLFAKHRRRYPPTPRTRPY